MPTPTSYDAVIIGAGHNGLVAACYLAMAGLRVAVLEKNEYIGGATRSQKVFPGVDARLSVYSYLVSLLPEKILADLGIHLELRRRAIASYTPVEKDSRPAGLLISNLSEQVTRDSFARLTRGNREYHGYRALESLVEQFAHKVWPTLLAPLPSKTDLRKQFQTPDEKKAWEYIVEKPLSALIEDHLADDTVRGAVFTDGKIGVLTHPDDPTLLQNRTFLYHAIGQGSGEWRVPVGGMGALVDALFAKARAHGVDFTTAAEVVRVDHHPQASTVYSLQNGAQAALQARYVLFNTSSDIANRILTGGYAEEQVPGSVFKINMVLQRLPALKDPQVAPRAGFMGTFHINEGYQHMQETYRAALGGQRIQALAGEMYCHSLTDPSILSPALQQQGYQTLTLFGLDIPYAWFTPANNDTLREEITQAYLDAINAYTNEEIRGCLALDAGGHPCIEARTPLDLESALGLPKGNIFHGNLSWPFADDAPGGSACTAAEAGAWGVETAYENVFICGSSARRGGAVSGIPGHNAAMKILGW